MVMDMTTKGKISLLPPHHVELNKLPVATLMRLCEAFGVGGTKATSSKEELVEIVKGCFMKWKLDEFDALEVFSDRLKVLQKKKHTLLKSRPLPSVSKRPRTEQLYPLPPEYRSNRDYDIDSNMHVLVAAKVGDRWILARLHPEEVIAPSKTLALRDEDDPSNVFSSPSHNVIPLSDECDPLITRGSRVLAVFPDTTAFYPATVVFFGREAVVCFDEDGEQTRHVARKYIIPMEDGLAISQSPPQEVTKNAYSTLSKKKRRKAAIGIDSEVSGGGIVNAPHSSVNGGTKNFGSGAGDQRSRGGSTGGGETYANMISKSLHNLPDQQGSFKDICYKIEQLYSSQLNWRLESDTRHTPVWQSSVRKILSASLATDLEMIAKEIYMNAKPILTCGQVGIP